MWPPDTLRQMTAGSCDASAGAVGLGALLVLLHGADATVDTVEVTYRLWRRRQRAHAPFVADAEEQKRRGAAITSYGLGKAQPEPVEYEETGRIWRAGERVRVELSLEAASVRLRGAPLLPRDGCGCWRERAGSSELRP